MLPPSHQFNGFAIDRQVAFEAQRRKNPSLSSMLRDEKSLNHNKKRLILLKGKPTA
jgi:hypothetical protein